MSFIISFLMIMSISLSMTMQSNGILTQQDGILAQANESNEVNVESQLSTVEEQVQMAVFAETSEFLQNNVIEDVDAGAKSMTNAIYSAVNNPSSRLTLSLPTGYTVSNPVMKSDTQVSFDVMADGSKYIATFDGMSQSTTVNLAE